MERRVGCWREKQKRKEKEKENGPTTKRMTYQRIWLDWTSAWGRSDDGRERKRTGYGSGDGGRLYNRFINWLGEEKCCQSSRGWRDELAWISTPSARWLMSFDAKFRSANGSVVVCGPLFALFRRRASLRTSLLFLSFIPSFLFSYLVLRPLWFWLTWWKANELTPPRRSFSSLFFFFNNSMVKTNLNHSRLLSSVWLSRTENTIQEWF